MTRRELILKSLREYGTCTAKELSNYIKRTYNEDVSSSSVSGTMRGLITSRLAASSKNGNDHTRYWAVKELEF